MSDGLDAVRARIIADSASGALRSLAEYVGLFPGADAYVARAYSEAHADTGDAAEAGRGAELIGHYRTLQELGRGGQGVVYLAEDLRLHRKVALKIMTGLGPGSEDSVARFRREAEVASKLAHPGICRVYDAGVSHGIPYIVMQYVEGRTLGERLAAQRCKTQANTRQSEIVFLDSVSGAGAAGPTSENPSAAPDRSTMSKSDVRETLRIVAKTALALHAAHEAGVVHRDIKPGNIMVGDDGDPVVLDFGLARADDAGVSLTRTGDFFGTPAYMSPEQLTGQRIRLDRRSDVYSLGVTLYELLTLRRPFEAPTFEALYQAVLTKSAPDPRKFNPAITSDLKVVLETALEKDRDRRYASTEAFAADLVALLEDRPIQARPAGPVGLFVRWSKREPAKAALLAVVLTAFPVIATLVTAHYKDRPQVESARLAQIEQERDDVLAEASFEVSEGDAHRAVALYARAIEMEGASPEAACGLVFAQLKLKNPGEALRLLDAHASLLGDGSAAHLLRADALRAAGKTEEAAAALASAPPPAAFFEYNLLAQKEAQLGEDGEHEAFRRAMHHLTTAILVSPLPRLSLYSLRAHLAGHLRDREAVLESIAGLRRRWPDSDKTHLWTGWSLASLGDPAYFQDAEAAFRALIRLKPGNSSGHLLLGQLMASTNRMEEAVVAFREAVRLAPTRADGHAALGEALWHGGAKAEAQAVLETAIRLRPDSLLTLGGLAQLYLEEGRRDDAIALLRRAPKVHPKSLPAQNMLGALLDQLGLPAEAQSVFEAVLALDPKDSVAHMNLGLVLMKQGRPKEAISAFAKSASLDVKRVGEFIGMAGGFEATEFTDDVIAIVRDCIRSAPDRADLRYHLGNLLAAAGFREEGAASLREAIRLDAGYAEAHCDLSGVLMPDRRFREALEEVRIGHELGSKRPDWQYPSAQWVKEAEAAVRNLEARDSELAEYRKTGARPTDAEELVASAVVAFDQGRYREASDWFRAGFASRPGLAKALASGLRRLAVSAAIRASVADPSVEPGLDPAARAALRVIALEDLEREVAAFWVEWEEERVPRTELIRIFRPFLRNPEFASVRERESLEALPAEERARWVMLWFELRSLLESAGLRTELR